MNASTDPIFSPPKNLADLHLVDLMQSVDVLQSQFRLDEASLLYEQWLAVSKDPMRYVAFYNYAALLQGLGRMDHAKETRL